MSPEPRCPLGTARAWQGAAWLLTWATPASGPTCRVGIGSGPGPQQGPRGGQGACLSPHCRQALRDAEPWLSSRLVQACVTSNSLHPLQTSASTPSCTCPPSGCTGANPCPQGVESPRPWACPPPSGQASYLSDAHTHTQATAVTTPTDCTPHPGPALKGPHNPTQQPGQSQSKKARCCPPCGPPPPA